MKIKFTKLICMSGDGIKVMIAKDDILSWFVLEKWKEHFFKLLFYSNIQWYTYILKTNNIQCNLCLSSLLDTTQIFIR